MQTLILLVVSAVSIAAAFLIFSFGISAEKSCQKAILYALTGISAGEAIFICTITYNFIGIYGFLQL